MNSMLACRVVAVVACAAVVITSVACAELIGIEDLSTSPDDDDGGIPCETPADCPVAGNECFVRQCVNNTCALADAGIGDPVASQIAGDCLVVVCDEGGNAIPQPDPADAFNDGNDCTDDACVDGVPANQPKAAGEACAAGVCDGALACVECTQPVHCTGGDTCQANVCVPASCTDGVISGQETDEDCGGPDCGKCGSGDMCEGPSDCLSNVCDGNQCQAATCTDKTHNGMETDVDCGGAMCPDCGVDDFCMSPEDCTSKVCTCEGVDCDPTCQAPTCTDGVMNGQEWSVDCGPMCAGTCGTGDECSAPAQCASFVCQGEVCIAPSCTDGVKNGTEMGIDCNGVSSGQTCPPCG